MLKENLLEIYAQSFRHNWDMPALTDYTTGDTMTYGDFARRIARLHTLFANAGIRRGDKIALMGRNTSSWVTIFFGTITYGAVIVPVLQDFNPQDAQHIINHSDAVMLFVSNSIWETLEYDKMPRLKGVLSLDDRQVLAESDGPDGKISTCRGNSVPPTNRDSAKSRCHIRSVPKTRLP